MATQNFKRNLLLNLYREGKNIASLFPPAPPFFLSRSVVSDSLPPHRLQPARLLCPWNSPGKNTGVGCHFLLQVPSIFPSIRVLSNESVLHIRWQKYWSFSFSLSSSNESSGLISFRMDWVGLLAVQGTLQSSPTPQFKASILWHSAFFIQSNSHSHA